MNMRIMMAFGFPDADFYCVKGVHSLFKNGKDQLIFVHKLFTEVNIFQTEVNFATFILQNRVL